MKKQVIDRLTISNISRRAEAVSGGWWGPSRHPLSVSGGADATPWTFKGVSTPLNLERWGEPNLRLEIVNPAGKI